MAKQRHSTTSPVIRLVVAQVNHLHKVIVWPVSGQSTQLGGTSGGCRRVSKGYLHRHKPVAVTSSRANGEEESYVNAVDIEPLETLALHCKARDLMDLRGGGVPSKANLLPR